MFDISFWELAIVGIVALVVIGPERLPGVARTAGHLFGRFQRYVAAVRSDIQRELDASELAKVRQEVSDAARVFETSVQEHASAFQGDIRAMDRALSAAAAPAPPATDAAVLSAPDGTAGATDTFRAPGPVPAALEDAPSGKAVPEHAATSDTTFGQGQFDFGIEPVRRSGA
ncbi:MAG: twin-arginine translocase subunit TatB [Betaproteobacteria bacterium]|nr:twin-arginine translocase subunit TatB [Betaproteobacteria bacterium]